MPTRRLVCAKSKTQRPPHKFDRLACGRMKTFLTASELSRATGHPVSRIIAGIESGIIAPDGRAGSNPNSAFIFAAERVDSIKSAIATGTPAPAPQPLRDLADVPAKAAAIHRAKEEAK